VTCPRITRIARRGEEEKETATEEEKATTDYPDSRNYTEEEGDKQQKCG
jgi:hypothetical protein